MPNELNYGSLEACKRLRDAEIVVETDFWWVNFPRTGWNIVKKQDADFVARIDSIPALSMAEAWRLLPGELKLKDIWYLKHLYQDQIYTYAEYVGLDRILLKQIKNTNPIDAMIDLKIWVEKEKKNGQK
jgi:hypothetical protein